MHACMLAALSGCPPEAEACTGMLAALSGCRLPEAASLENCLAGECLPGERLPSLL